MKTVYFVRHGETDGNKGGYYQHPNDPLSSEGVEQAKFVARRFLAIPTDVIISSAFDRARNTAKTISEAVNVHVVENKDFHEKIRPSAVRGRSRTEPEVVNIIAQTEKDFETGRKHSDEENLNDLKKRASRCLQYLIDRPEESILVVTHGQFLKVLVLTMMFGDALTARDYWAFNDLFFPSNTGITKCTYDNKRWTLWTWNDHAHLG